MEILSHCQKGDILVLLLVLLQMDIGERSRLEWARRIAATTAVVGGIALDAVVAAAVVRLHTFGAVVVGNFCCFVDAMGNAE